MHIAFALLLIGLDRLLRLKEEFNRAGPVLRLLLRYTQALITQMTQTAVCNRHHSVEQQLRRWLLLSIDGRDWKMPCASATPW
jgi:hypothetical protein